LGVRTETKVVATDNILLHDILPLHVNSRLNLSSNVSPSNIFPTERNSQQICLILQSRRIPTTSSTRTRTQGRRQAKAAKAPPNMSTLACTYAGCCRHTSRPSLRRPDWLPAKAASNSNVAVLTAHWSNSSRNFFSFYF